MGRVALVTDNSVTPKGIDSTGVTAGQGLVYDGASGRFLPGSSSVTGTAGGDLSGSYPNPTVSQIQGRPVSSSVPGSSQALVWNGSAWAPAAVMNSFNGRTGAVTPNTGDYTAAAVTNAADKGSGAQQAFAGEVKAPDFAPAGLAGATAASRYVGGTASGAPTTGTFTTGDYVVDRTGKIWICTASGSPGTWTTGTAVVGGDLTGNMPNPTIAAAAVTLAKIATGATGLAAEGFSVYRNAAQTLSTAAGTKIAFDTKEDDISSRVDITTNVGRFTPQTAGYYRLSAFSNINTALTAGQTFGIALYKNGALAKLGTQQYGAIAAGGGASLTSARLHANGTTDYFEAWLFWAGPTTVAVYTGPTANGFSGELVGKG